MKIGLIDEAQIVKEIMDGECIVMCDDISDIVKCKHMAIIGWINLLTPIYDRTTKQIIMIVCKRPKA